MARFVKSGSKQNPIKVLWEIFSSLDKFTKLFIITGLLTIVSISYIVNNSQTLQQSAATSYDLKSYYPNNNMFNKYYLEGFNYINNTPTKSVLWFEPQDQWTYKMYNSAPEDVNSRCHYDQLSWWDDGFLRYVKTHDECPGKTPNEIVYDAPIIFLPSLWDGSTPWSLSGQSNAKYYQNGVVVCEGTNSYKAEIIGLEQIAPNEQGIHWKTTQTTNWISGSVPGGCSAGSTTHWQEDYWLTDILPVQNGVSTKALKRSKGGNLDIPSDSWDIWFDSWKLLPWITPTPTPFYTPTPTPTPTPKDITPPLVSITSPLNRTTVPKSTVITLKATASDNVAISKVEFYYKGGKVTGNTLLCTDTSASYICDWTTPNTGNTYTITAKAYDTSNNTSSTTIKLNVR